MRFFLSTGTNSTKQPCISREHAMVWTPSCRRCLASPTIVPTMSLFVYRCWRNWRRSSATSRISVTQRGRMPCVRPGTNDYSGASRTSKCGSGCSKSGLSLPRPVRIWICGSNSPTSAASLIVWVSLSVLLGLLKPLCLTETVPGLLRLLKSPMLGLNSTGQWVASASLFRC